MKAVILLFIVIAVFCSCGNDLTLKKIEITNNTEMDTIEIYPIKGLYIVNIITNGTFGRFSMNLAVIKKVNGLNQVAYELPEPRDCGSRVSKDYIAYVNSSGVADWGWFNIKNGKILKELPNIDHILDSLKSSNQNDLFIREKNGDITFFKKGKVLKTMNYGEFVTKHKDVKFDSLDYRLYHLEHDSLLVVSNNADDLFKQKSGVFFIPRPGYGVTKKYDKHEILKMVDSDSKLREPPHTISIKAVLAK
jgi:hypothetical protein